MAPSIRGSDFAELAPVAVLAPSLLRQRSAWRAVLSLPGGRIGAALTLVTLATALLAPVVVRSDPFALVAAPLLPPTVAHPMGTDAIGRDLLSGVVHGARTSLMVAGGVTLLAFACGAAVGMTAGWRGGLLDDALMRVTELFQVVPR